jgi:hypothetical protein
MLYYFETLIERLQALKNHDLMLKITLDLIDTFKFKVNEMNPEDHYLYVQKINAVLNNIRTLCKSHPLAHQLAYNQAKLNLAFALILDQLLAPSNPSYPSHYASLDALFLKAISSLRSLPKPQPSASTSTTLLSTTIADQSASNYYSLDLAAANFHRGKFLGRH